MSYAVEFDDTALDDLEEIRAYLSEHSTKAYPQFLTVLENRISLIENNPRLFKSFEHNPAYRRMGLDYGFVAFYSIDDDDKIIGVRTIVHGTRNIVPYMNRLEKRKHPPESDQDE